MPRRHFRSLALLGIVGISAILGIRSPSNAQGEPKQRTVPADIQQRPFSIESSEDSSSTDPMRLAAVQFRAADRMESRDRLLQSDAESSIAEHAAQLRYDLGAGAWAYQQIVCPAFPGHLFLQYKRRAGAGDVTEFSASIPRGNEGRVRIIPILKRSYSLFAPAPISAVTIAAFNHIRAEEADAAESHWLGNALCYAALTGAHPVLVATGDEGKEAPPAHSQVAAQLVVPLRGGEQIQFDDDADAAHPVQWTLFFNPKGQVVKATRRRIDAVHVRPVPESSAVTRTWSVPSAATP